MVVKGRGKFPRNKQPNRIPPTPNITRIASLKRFETHEKALDLLHEIAQLTTPLIHHFGFKIGLLCEMYPKNANLLGLNVNGGQKICLRLRSASNPSWFLEIRDILGTMLHELTHNVHGPHNAAFYKYLDQLKDKYFELELQKNGSSHLAATSNIVVYKPSNTKLNKGGGIKANSEEIRNQRIKKMGATALITKVGKLGTNMKEGTDKSVPLRDLMRDALNRRIPTISNKSCGQENEENNAPNDNELVINEVVNLVSDDEAEPFTIKNEDTNTPKEVIILD